MDRHNKSREFSSSEIKKFTGNYFSRQDSPPLSSGGRRDSRTAGSGRGGVGVYGHQASSSRVQDSARIDSGGRPSYGRQASESRADDFPHSHFWPSIRRGYGHQASASRVNDSTGVDSLGRPLGGYGHQASASRVDDSRRIDSLGRPSGSYGHQTSASRVPDFPHNDSKPLIRGGYRHQASTLPADDSTRSHSLGRPLSSGLGQTHAGHTVDDIQVVTRDYRRQMEFRNGQLSVRANERHRTQTVRRDNEEFELRESVQTKHMAYRWNEALLF